MERERAMTGETLIYRIFLGVRRYCRKIHGEGSKVARGEGRGNAVRESGLVCCKVDAIMVIRQCSMTNW